MTREQADALKEQRKDEAELQRSGYYAEPTDGEIDAIWGANRLRMAEYDKTHPSPSKPMLDECKRRDPDFLGGQSAIMRRERDDVAAECAESHEQHWLQAHGLR